MVVGRRHVDTASCAWSGMVADRFPKGSVLAFGYALACVPAALLLVPAAGLFTYALVFATSGLYMGFWETVESASAASYLSKDNRGVGFGALDAVNGSADVGSSVLVGALWMISPGAAMGFVVATSLLGAVLVLYAGRGTVTAS